MVRFLPLLLSIGALFGATRVNAQTTPDPKHELRSFWLTTASALDWPKGSTPAEQQASLREIIQRAKAMGMNAVVFQIASRGDAYYRSDRLPWSSQLTGVIGRDPGWDPLQFAIDETRALGMELHAWFNAFNVGSASVTEPGAPLHVSQTNPGWIAARNDGTWVNPGYPAAQDWVVANVIELLDRYDVDAINFDFLRYPSNGFTDDFGLHLQYGGNTNLQDWKRANVTAVPRRVMQWVQANKPWIKVGSAPIGHYKTSGGWPALYAFHAVHQDSRGWLRDGWMDYIMPQIYWKIYSGPYTSSPEHSWIVRDYARETYGRHVYVGIGAYVDGTIQQLPAMIDTSRVNGLKGQVYFRWGSIYAFNVQTGTVGPQITYRKPAIVPSMSWRSQAAPGQPFITSHNRTGQDVTLSWEPVSFDDNGDTLVRYAVYRVIGNTAPDPEVVITDVQNLVTLTGGTSLTNRLPATDQNVYYVVTALSRNNVESLPSQPYLVPTSTSVEPEPGVPYVTGLDANYPNPFNPTTVIGFQLSVFGQARLSVYDLLGREIAVLADGAYPAGRHEVVFDAGNLDLASGVYVTVLRVGDRQFTRRITLLK
jgi:uncharacterized lipoprotein YddW (UPF0748 family)